MCTGTTSIRSCDVVSLSPRSCRVSAALAVLALAGAAHAAPDQGRGGNDADKQVRDVVVQVQTDNASQGDPRVSIDNADGIAVVRVVGPGGWNTTTGYYQFVENGRKVEITLKNDAVTEAKIDGQAIPADRASLANDKVTIKDADGKVLFEHQFDSNDAGLTPQADRSVLFTDPEQAARLHKKWNMRVAEPAEAPKVMLGVQMMGVPDVLRGHLGLEKGSGVLISAVHEGLPAANAGLKPYDIVVGAGGKEPIDDQALRGMLHDLNAGDKLELSVIQKGERRKLTVTLEAFDGEKLESSKAESISSMDVSGGGAAGWGAGGASPLTTITVPGGTLRGAPGQGFGPGAQVWTWSGGEPVVPGDLNERIEEIMRQAMERAARGQALAGSAQADMDAAQARMRERMERMEKMMEEMLKRQNEAPASKAAEPKPGDGQS